MSKTKVGGETWCGRGDMVMRLQAFFVAHTGIQIHALHEM